MAPGELRRENFAATLLEAKVGRLDMKTGFIGPGIFARDEDHPDFSAIYRVMKDY